MGRVQNAFYFCGVWLQLVLGLSVGLVAHRYSLTLGYIVIGVTYALAMILSTVSSKRSAAESVTT
jgi:hypothetical protein